MRFAIYFTPEKDHPLTRRAAQWLGRDAFSGEVLPSPAAGPLSPAEVAFQTAAARRYGFHATLKAPFRLAEGVSESELIGAVENFAQSQEPVCLPEITLRRLDGFFAILPSQGSAALANLAANVVTAFERFRAPLTAAEIERRNPDALTPGQLKNLHKWGYPYVFEEFRFHMTLTGRVAAAEQERVAKAIEGFFGPLLSGPLDVDGLAVFVESEPGAPFHIRSFHPMGPIRKRKYA
ncbi:putative phosphonate metabolism protein [Mesorhizobium sp. J18]|uniref:DUF1045 domain-containing protein n=1 Tax=Mesorhizobium sp. J18 TaxID=935263 RepID=UPI00119C21DF|nr:DUF1045 domain-containing protein [Mesorhizobium sp. J18]TWG91279.1 putative phosphonate metabolism protein [Mesorhizobium sp. J18]